MLIKKNSIPIFSKTVSTRSGVSAYKLGLVFIGN